jgi:hypothetical protein
METASKTTAQNVPRQIRKTRMLTSRLARSIPRPLPKSSQIAAAWRDRRNFRIQQQVLWTLPTEVGKNRRLTLSARKNQREEK